MNRFLIVISMIITLVFAVSEPASAQLSQLTNADGEHALFSGGSNLYLYPKLLDFINMTYDQQLATIDALNINTYFGISNWRMASYYIDMENIWADDHSISSWSIIETNLYSTDWKHWVARTSDFDPDDTELHLATNFLWDSAGLSIDAIHDLDPFKVSDYSNNYLAWVVSNGPVSVPEPSILLLLGSGVFSLILLKSLRLKRTS